MLLALLLTVVLVGGAGAWLAIAQPWAAPAASDSPTPKPEPEKTTETDTESPSPEPSDEPTDEETPVLVACRARDIQVQAVTDADTYASGVLPNLSISLTNHGKTDCTIDVGSATQRFTVVSGSDEWWHSTDCQENPSSMIATLAAGATVVSKTPVVWDRTRSSVDTCAQESRQRAPGGGASYHVSVEIGGFKAAQTKLILLY